MKVCATGFFDGVHLGHREIITALVREAKELGHKSAVITFWPHPRTILQQDAYQLRLLTTMEEKKEQILGLGVDYFHVVHFSKEFSQLTTKEFLETYLKEKYGITSMIIGYDHRLGRDKLPSRSSLSEIALSCGINTIEVGEYYHSNKRVSSTIVRNKLLEGMVGEANELLGYRYSMKGVVVLGNRIGRTIGFPTANMQLYEPLKLVPGNGVYYVKAHVQGKEYDGICNIGTRPTIGSNNQVTIETHILNFNEGIYGIDLKLDFMEWIRPERKFDSLTDLKKQLELDKAAVGDIKEKIKLAEH